MAFDERIKKLDAYLKEFVAREEEMMKQYHETSNTLNKRLDTLETTNEQLEAELTKTEQLAKEVQAASNALETSLSALEANAQKLRKEASNITVEEVLIACFITIMFGFLAYMTWLNL